MIETKQIEAIRDSVASVLPLFRELAENSCPESYTVANLCRDECMIPRYPIHGIKRHSYDFVQDKIAKISDVVDFNHNDYPRQLLIEHGRTHFIFLHKSGIYCIHI